MNNIATILRESRVGRFFIPLGIILIVVGIILFIINDQHKDFIKTEATVSKTELYEESYTDTEGNYVDATYKVYVKYIADGKEYEEELGILSNVKVGDKRTIVYNPKNPTEISDPVGIILPSVVLVAGIASLVGGIISIVKVIKKHKEMKAQEEAWASGK